MNVLDRVFLFVESLPISDRVILKTLLVVSFATSLGALAYASYSASTEIPGSGGELREGVVGTPRFLNPLLAITQPDKDMSALIYSGLMRLSKDGSLEPDMAESVTISNDGLTYNVVLKSNLKFQDGTPVTVDDILFTISRIQDPQLKSPLRPNWDGVTTERLSDTELNFMLTQPFAPFIENLTVGILPKHIWENATTEELPFSKYNSEPIGSGPYEVTRISRTASGIPNAYTLVPFKNYAGTTPHIEQLTMNFYPNEDALVEAFTAKKIESAASLSPQSIATIMDVPGNKDHFTLYQTPLPRTFALFLNQNENPIFRDLAVRRALDVSLDRSALVHDVLSGYGDPIDGPIPPGFGPTDSYIGTTSPLARLDTARDILRQGGWKINEGTGLWEKRDKDQAMQLKFSIATANMPSFEAAAEHLRATWSDLGIPVEVKKFEQSDLTQTVIRPRKYETLLFGTAVGREFDFYSFWHSSQRSDPGLNIALYANLTTDSILADTRTRVQKDERTDADERFAAEMRTDLPALFLYVPEFTYLAPKNIENISLTGLEAPSERFSTIGNWYRETERVWPLFTTH